MPRRVLDAWTGMSVRSKLSLGAAAILLASALFVLLGTRSGTSGFVPLASGLEAEEADQVVKALEQQKIPFELADGGASILVPKDKADRARLQLAGEGLPQSAGGAGFELFDRNSLTLTDFTERVAYQRALQGELSRTLKSLEGVTSARVHLSIPEPALFEKDVRKASAAVTVAFEGQPSSEQVRAIVQTVAKSVPDLEPERITVSTSEGRVVWSGSRDASAGAEDHLTLRRQVETDLETRLKGLLTPLVGDRAVLRVTATLDMSAAEVTAEQYSPSTDGVPLKSRKSVDEEYGPPERGQPKRRYDRREEAVEYQLSKETRRTQVPAGRVQRLQVAVLVDSQVANERTLEAIERTLEVAAGLDKVRGDELVVQAVPFRAVSPGARSAPSPDKTESRSSAPTKGFPWAPVGVGAALSVLAAAFLLVWMRRPRHAEDEADEPGETPTSTHEDRELLRLLNDWSHERVDL